jgi:hypothetical protein
LLSLVAKSTGIGEALLKNRNKLGRIHIAMLSGRFVRHESRSHPDEVDLLIVGDVDLNELASIVRAEETRRGQTINYTPMSEDELKFRRTRRDPFLLGILTNSRVMVIGSDLDLT